MQITVILLNVTLALCCLAVAYRLWWWRRCLRQTTQVLLLTELAVHDTLKELPSRLTQGQFNLRQWTQLLGQLERVTGQARQVIIWAGQVQQLSAILMAVTWRRRSMKPMK